MHVSTSSASTPSHSSGVAPSSYSPPAAPAATTPVQPTLTPRQVLMHRLHDIRRHHHVGTGDPVAQAFHYVASLSRLTA